MTDGVLNQENAQWSQWLGLSAISRLPRITTFAKAAASIWIFQLCWANTDALALSIALHTSNSNGHLSAQIRLNCSRCHQICHDDR
jgi:hypothetical protein